MGRGEVKSFKTFEHEFGEVCLASHSKEECRRHQGSLFDVQKIEQATIRITILPQLPDYAVGANTVKCGIPALLRKTDNEQKTHCFCAISILVLVSKLKLHWQAEKKRYSLKEWEEKLATATVRKEDMNELVMNFLVTEVLPSLGFRSSKLHFEIA